MNIIFLRGSVPPKNEHPEKLLYDDIEDCSDVWSQLFYYLTRNFSAKAELLYQNKINIETSFVVSDFFTERRVPKLKRYAPDFIPDLIVCRGGFDYYEPFIKKYPKAKQVYYGAGVRYYPEGYNKYDLFLVDSPKQKKKIDKKGHRAELFIKPAAMLFEPKDTEKQYDICFIANGTQRGIKRHELFLKSFAGSKYKILNLGNISKKIVKLAQQLAVNITWGDWSLRKYLPPKISQCKVGVCCSTNYDSCPRVIPEYLACGLPVVATKNINFWHDKYITPETGLLVEEDGLKKGVKKILRCHYDVRPYYDNYLNMEEASEHLHGLIEEIL